jgi:hypothetical protein
VETAESSRETPDSSVIEESPPDMPHEDCFFEELLQISVIDSLANGDRLVVETEGKNVLMGNAITSQEASSSS